MQVKINVPLPIEGSWKIVAANGDVLLDSDTNDDAGPPTLVIEPVFYEGLGRFQTAARIAVVGSKGKTAPQVLRVSGGTGRLAVDSGNKLPKRISPAFDKQVPNDKGTSTPKEDDDGK
jgi:hypothetical protein